MIYPIPRKITEKNGCFSFKEKLPVCELLSFIKVAKTAKEITYLNEPLFSKEEYKLDITEVGVTVSSSCDEGLFRALSSLYQILRTEGNSLPCRTVEDKPDFERRGYMLDISRCRMPKLETLKELVDSLALLKYNEFQLYMENFCFKYPLLPAVTDGFECLEPEDIAKLEEYCAERYIDLVPNQNCLGHMGKWLEREEYKHLGVGAEKGESTGTINPLLPESRKLVSDIFDSLLPSFRSGFVNVGLDEAYGLGKYELEEICREKTTPGFFMDYLNHINDSVGKKYGKRLQFWADMIINHPDYFDRIPKDAIALEWGYELIQSQLMSEHCAALQAKGANFYVCPSTNTHFSFTGRSDVTVFNLRTAGEVGRQYGAMGYLVTDWGMGYEGHPHFGIWSYIPAALGGQYAWSVGDAQNGENFKTDYIRGAIDFVDTYRLGGAKVSELLYRASNYYLLEPDRIHCGTMCGQLFPFPIEKTGYFHLFDLKNYGDTDFCFDNVIRYMQDLMIRIEKTELDSQHKREAFVNMRSVILSAEIAKIRMGNIPDKEKINALIAEIDSVYEEFRELWLLRNYEKGIDCFLGVLTARRSELERFL